MSRKSLYQGRVNIRGMKRPKAGEKEHRKRERDYKTLNSKRKVDPCICLVLFILEIQDLYVVVEILNYWSA